MTTAYTYKIDDYCREQTVTVYSSKFMNPYESDECEIYKFRFISLCDDKVRKELTQRFIDSPLLKQVWKWIDKIYAVFFESAMNEFHTKLKTAINKEKFIRNELENLIDRQRSEYHSIKTQNTDNINFYKNFISVMGDEIEYNCKEINELINENDGKDENGNIKLSNLKQRENWRKLIESIQNITHERLVVIFSDLLKQQKEPNEVKSITSEVEPNDIYSFKNIFHDIRQKFLVFDILKEINYESKPIITKADDFGYKINLTGKFKFLAALNEILQEKNLLKTSNKHDLARAFCHEFNVEIPSDPKQFEKNYTGNAGIDKYRQILAPLKNSELIRKIRN